MIRGVCKLPTSTVSCVGEPLPHLNWLTEGTAGSEVCFDGCQPPVQSISPALKITFWPTGGPRLLGDTARDTIM
ncbi:hypothetical protein J4Q44_G00038070 [Coregonus suidteri]|uniref:Uncharacterized protein n=1 Tax=Coregonus suidteri TaxID=861788 RepID=A0AAN8M425_9TELE